MKITSKIALGLFFIALAGHAQSHTFNWGSDLIELKEMENMKSGHSSILNDHQKSYDYLLKLSDQAQSGEFHAYHMNLFHQALKTHINLSRELSNSDNLLEQLLLIERSFDLQQNIYQNKLLRRVTRDFLKIKSYQLDTLPSLYKELFSKDRQETIEQKLKNLQSPTKEVQSTKAYALFKKEGNLDGLFKVAHPFKAFGDKAGQILRGATTVLSAGFAAVASPISWRSGRLKSNQKLMKILQRDLKPFDLVFEKKKYKLTDYTIPGYWGHVGMYLGTKEQLIDLGIWDNPSMKIFREKIEKGYAIFEVRRQGLKFVKLKNWINLDEMGVVRVKGILDRPQEELALTAERLGMQFGRGYDYAFDYYSASKTTCTEIMSLSYGPIKWATSKIAGRLTLSPDNMMGMAFYENSPLEFVGFFKGSKKGLEIKSMQDLGSTLGYERNEQLSSTSDYYHMKKTRCTYQTVRKGKTSKRVANCEDYYIHQIYGNK